MPHESSPNDTTAKHRCARGIAALGVVFYHAIEQSDKVVPNNLFKYPVRLLQLGASFGYIGVFLFFVISGFCIHLQWARARANEQEPQIRFGAFWKRRIRRLYPPYLITLALFFFFSATTVGLNVTHFCLRRRDAFTDASQSRSENVLQHQRCILDPCDRGTTLPCLLPITLSSQTLGMESGADYVPAGSAWLDGFSHLSG